MEYGKSLKDTIADSIREDIILCTLKPGERLVEPKLSERFGISRTPIREAFRQLEGEGFIKIIPRKGAIVTEITPKDVDDLYLIAAKLEGLAAYLSAPYITPEDIAVMSRKNTELEKLQGQVVSRDYSFINNSFHAIFINKCQNERLIRILYSLSRQFDRFRNLAMTMTDKVDAAVLDHQSIIDAFGAKDAKLVEDLVYNHVLQSGERLKKLLLSKKS
ncbi:GntR family transcriptional regulator [Desulfurispirillum indicum]|uniref:GntR domain protein n=1 Tax=Desulfurispirillum indicum (strain ATCC BAA-1389 / DSM 22839 / S5) TaxID=653733 RepID=E6W590_DESIS|nr:GntR family transcriptional regulator [Desulfurispirillum indicum]ADU67169.1 GntR domain protein [Desulfurispirillum indicum S5]UCZ56492.1 GntR family transcriptional regulator [Desulfurispirillum indicum]